MGLSPHGPMCDVCGMNIWPFDPKERVNFFGIKGIQGQLMSDNACKKILKKMSKTQDWQILPEGPLKRFYEKNRDKIVMNN